MAEPFRCIFPFRDGPNDSLVPSARPERLQSSPVLSVFQTSPRPRSVFVTLFRDAKHSCLTHWRFTNGASAHCQVKKSFFPLPSFSYYPSRGHPVGTSSRSIPPSMGPNSRRPGSPGYRRSRSVTAAPRWVGADGSSAVSFSRPASPPCSTFRPYCACCKAVPPPGSAGSGCSMDPTRGNNCPE